MATDLLSKVAIVLVQPKYPENIGAAARSAMNMGISRLMVVKDEMPDVARMRKMATCHARTLIDSLELFNNLGEALANFSWVVGTTARRGRQRRLITTPDKMVSALLPKLSSNHVALLFGAEDRGLTNEDLKYCNCLTTIPTADFSSLNLAQAVAILSYELHREVLKSNKNTPKKTAQLASIRQRENVYQNIEKMLRLIGYLKESDYDYWMKNIRNFLGRIELKSREVKFLQAICKQVMWYSAKTNPGGREHGKVEQKCAHDETPFQDE